MRPIAIPHRIASLEAARLHVAAFPCPEGFSRFAWKQLQQTAISAWHAHLGKTTFRGNLNFCRPEFYNMLRHPDGHSIVSPDRIRRYKAA